MIATLRTMSAGALALVLLAGPSWAEDKPATPSPEEMTKIMAEAGQPGPEHAKLQPLAGSWTYTCKLWMDPSQPPMESTGTIERAWVLGGRFLEEKYKGTGVAGQPDFEARGLLGYDNAQKKYTSTFVCNMGTGVCTGLGASEAPDTLTLHTEMFCPMLKKTIQGRDEIRIESPDRFVMESFVIQDGQEVRVMELVAVRKK